MKLTDYRNTTPEQVRSKTYNIWLGVSLGNRYFNQQHLEDYIRSSLDLVREKMLVIITDEPHGINYEVFEGMRPDTAIAKAVRKGQKVLGTVADIIKQLSADQRDKIELIKWPDISATTWYQQRLAIFAQEFKTNPDFKTKLIEIVRLNMGDRLEELSPEEVTKLTAYVLQELPIFIGAISYKSTNYDLHIYPGLSLMDDFILDLQAGKAFPQLIKQMQIVKPLAIAEAYAE